MSAKQINETEIEFRVQDDGMGVPKDDIPHILKRFGQGSTNVLRKQQEEGTMQTAEADLAQKLAADLNTGLKQGVTAKLKQSKGKQCKLFFQIRKETLLYSLGQYY